MSKHAYVELESFSVTVQMMEVVHLLEAMDLVEQLLEVLDLVGHMLEVERRPRRRLCQLDQLRKRELSSSRPTPEESSNHFQEIIFPIQI